MFKFLIITALPVAFLLAYLYRKDRERPEPKKKLATCFGLGMLGGIVGGLILGIFELFGIGSDYSSLLYVGVVEGAVTSAVFVSIVYLILWKYSERNPDFNEYFDGPVYATCIAFGYEVICDLFSISSDEWYFLGLISIMMIVVVYAMALAIGYYYSLAHFGDMEMNTENKLKMWGVPFLIVWIYNILVTWYNTSILGTIVGLAAFAVFTYYVYKKNNEIVALLQSKDKEREITP